MNMRLELVPIPVTDVDRAKAFYAERGVEVGEVDVLTQPGKPAISYAYFKDPDGSGWALQQLPY